VPAKETAIMPSQASKLPNPLWAYREPPAGLSAEWQRNYEALADPVTRVVTFQPDVARLGTTELFEAWFDTLRRSEAIAEVVLAFLHGRSNRTWTAGHAIKSAISPISAAINATARFLRQPTPTRNGPEATAHGLRENIAGKLNAFEPVPLLDNLSAAVVADCAAQLGKPVPTQCMPAKPQKTKGKGIDERMLATIRDDSELIYLSSHQWAMRFGCSHSTVLGTKTWKQSCKPARERDRLARGKRLRKRNPR
jgi:hypothetical protein